MLYNSNHKKPPEVHSIETDSGPCQGLWGKDEELVFSGDRVSVWKDEKVQEEDGSDGCTAM